MYYVFNCSCVVARSVFLNSTCVKNLESPFYMNLEIKIYQIKYVLLFFCGASYSSIKSLCWFSAWLRFFTHLFALTMLCPTCVFFSPNCCEVVSPLFLLSLTTRSSIVATFVLGWSWRISTPWNRRHRKWNSG